MPVQINTSDVHRSPGFIEHQNWIDFAASQRFAGWYAFCLDGKMLQSGGGRLTSARA